MSHSCNCHETRDTAHIYLYHHIKLKTLNPTLVIVSSQTQHCYQLLASTCFLLFSDKTQQREQTIEAWAARDTCCHLPGTGDRTSVTRPSSAWLLCPGDLGILLRHLNTQLRARTDGAWSCHIAIEIRRLAVLSLSSHHVL